MQQPSGSFTYLGHSVSYKIGLPIGAYPHDWRIRYRLKIDDGEYDNVVGYIPLRITGIRKAAKIMIGKIH